MPLTSPLQNVFLELTTILEFRKAMLSAVLTNTLLGCYKNYGESRPAATAMQSNIFPLSKYLLFYLFPNSWGKVHFFSSDGEDKNIMSL